MNAEVPWDLGDSNAGWRIGGHLEEREWDLELSHSQPGLRHLVQIAPWDPVGPRHLRGT